MKISLNELRNLVKKVLKEESEGMGINLRSLLDGELAMANDNNVDFSNYRERNRFIDKIEDRLMESDWISMSNGTTFKQSFSPNKRSSEEY
jgi:hypothetical protein